MEKLKGKLFDAAKVVEKEIKDLFNLNCSCFDKNKEEASEKIYESGIKYQSQDIPSQLSSPRANSKNNIKSKNKIKSNKSCSIVQVSQKSFKDESDISDIAEDKIQILSQSDKEESKLSITISESCFNCKNSFDLIQLQCKHWACDPCLSNMLEFQCSKDTVSTLKCKCNRVIKSKIFQDLVLEETLLEYLDRLNSYRIANFKNSECSVCGHFHKKETKCSKFYKENLNTKQCEGCTQPEEYLLPCSHSYCGKCLKEIIINTWEQDPSSYVYCKFCEQNKIIQIVPLLLLQSCFGGQQNYEEKKKKCTKNSKAPNIECRICQHTLRATKFITLDCDHRFCSKCIGQYLEEKILSMKVLEMVCPDCNKEIDYNIIKGNVSSELYKRYDNLSIKAFNDLRRPSETMIWCGICEFGYVCSVYSMGTKKCPYCKDKKVYEASNIPENIVKCPGCSNGVLKETGCNFIQCGWPTCNIYFCTLCEKQLKLSEHYSHYKTTGPFGNTCNNLDKPFNNK